MYAALPFEIFSFAMVEVDLQVVNVFAALKHAFRNILYHFLFFSRKYIIKYNYVLDIPAIACNETSEYRIEELFHTDLRSLQWTYRIFRSFCRMRFQTLNFGSK